MEFNTALLHEKWDGDKTTGASLAPIYQANAFSHESAEEIEKIFSNRAAGFTYTRIANPTVDAFEKRIAALEGGIGAVACASGMAAVSLSLLNLLESGDEVIASSKLYGGTIDLFSDLEAFGIKTVFTKELTAKDIEPLITDKTKVVFAELIGNPSLDVLDLQEVSSLAHEHGIPLIVDSTTATPYLVKPIDFGADIVVHSTSKYINGSGNSLGGIIIDGGHFKWDDRFRQIAEYKVFGKFAYLAKLRNGIWRNIGVCESPFNAFLNSIGLETLGLRMERLCQNALELAEALKADGVSVNYPALPESPYYELVKKQFKGLGGAILTIRAGSRKKAFRLMNSLKYAAIVSNIGDVRTLVVHPASTIYVHNTPEERENAGVYDDTIRVSVGIENVQDLIEDFKNAILLSKGEEEDG